MRRWLALFSIAALSLIVLFFFAQETKPIPKPDAASASSAPTLAAPTVTFIDPAIGNKTAAVTIVEFADFGCAPCQLLAASLADVLKAHPSDVRIVWKDLPNDASHPLSTDAAVAAHCADRQGEFWEFHDALFSRGTALSADEFDAIATVLGLNLTAFDACVSTQDTLAVVQHDLDESKALGLTATPTTYVNGQKVVGAISSDELNGYVANALQAKK